MDGNQPTSAMPLQVQAGPAAVACALFLLAWLAMARDVWPRLPLGRAVSVVGVAALFVATMLLSPEAAFAAVNVPTIALLLGCMVVSGVMEKHEVYAMLSWALARGAPSPSMLLLRVSCIAALSAAFITNDASCVVLTPLVLRACLARRLHPSPFLIALATSANIGSACSPIGNPQNMIIALVGHLLFAGDFLRGVLAASLLSMLINIVVCTGVFRRELLVGAEYDATPQQLRLLGLDPADISVGHGANHVAAEHDVAPKGNDAQPALPIAPEAPAPAAEAFAVAPKVLLRRRAIYVVLMALPLLLLAADSWIGLPWLVLLAASLLLVLDGEPPDAVLAAVDARLLLFFAGLFVVVAGVGATGIPQVAWDAAVSAGVGVSGGAARVALFALVVLIGSNTVSNVPLVLLIAPDITALPPDERRTTWLLLAFISAVAGNLTLVGSVANLIVAERSRAIGVELSFFQYARVGVPSTLLVLAVGTPLVWACVQ